MKLKHKIISFILCIFILIPIFTIFASAYYELEYQIFYLDESGNELAEKEYGTINLEAQSLNIESPKIEGYSLKNKNDEYITYKHLNISYSPSHYSRHASGTYNVIYRKNYTIRVQYIFSDRTTAKSDYVFSSPIGTEFNIKSENLDGYTCDKSFISGVIEGDKEYIVTYYPNKYYVTYHKDNGEENITVGKGHNTKIKVIDDIPYSSSGFFAYWYDYENKKAYYTGDYIEENKNIDLYAIFTKNDIYITYNGNGGVCNIEKQIKQYDVDINLTSEIPIRDGYSFVGWGKSEYDTKPQYFPGDLYKQNMPLNLYAIWSIISNSNPIYLVTYSGEGGDNIPDDQIKEFNIDLILSEKIPVKSGYSFLYWQSSNGEIFNPGDEYKDNSPLYLKAIYSPLTIITYYTITYDANGGSSPPSKQSQSSEYPIVITSETPIYANHVFWGWSKNPNAKEPEYMPGDLYTELKDITLYAIYILDDEAYYVIYNANGGRFGLDKQIKKQDKDLILTNDTPRRVDYIFKYWSSRKDGLGEIYYPGSTYTKNESITLYAIWEEDFETYYVIYNLMGGYDCPEYDIKKEKEDIHITPIIPKKDGYKFIGWSNSEYGDVIYMPYDLYSDDSNIVLYARYTQETYIYHITYFANGGDNIPENQIKYKGETSYISMNIPTRLGYEFMFWCTDPIKIEGIFSPGEEYSEDKDLYLYAIWEFIGYDFEISKLEINKTNFNNDENINIKVFVKNNTDEASPKLSVYFDNICIYSENLILKPGAGASVMIDYILETGENGTKEIKARINDDFMYEEIDYTNNEKKMNVNINAQREILITGINNYDGYIEGEDVFTSVYIENKSDIDIYPYNNLTCSFEIYKKDANGNKVNLTEKYILEHVPIPKHEKNIAYYKWHIDDGLGNENIYIHIEAQCNGLELYDDITFSVKIKKNHIYTCENTKFEYTPKSFYKAQKSSYKTSLNYYSFEYENGMFLKTEHTIVPNPSLIIYPCTNTPYYRDESGFVYIKSGYPVGVLYTIFLIIDEHTDYILPKYPVCLYPEFMYEQEEGKCSSLDKLTNVYILPIDENGESSHYTPVWQADDKYTIFAYSGIIKTPGGNVFSVDESNMIYIDSNLFTDWYVGGEG